MHIQGAKMHCTQAQSGHAAGIGMGGAKNGMEKAKISLGGKDIEQAATVDISEAARGMMEAIRGADSGALKLKAAEDSLFDALDGKVQDARGTARKLAQMLAGGEGSESVEGLEERIRGREEGLAIAQRIAENFFDSPKEANKFMDAVNEMARDAEMADRGYAKGEYGVYYKNIPDCESDKELYERGKEFDERDGDVLYKISDIRKETKGTSIEDLLAKHHIALKEDEQPKAQEIRIGGQKAQFASHVGYNIISMR